MPQWVKDLALSDMAQVPSSALEFPHILGIAKKKKKFPLCLSGSRTQHGLPEDTGSNPGLAQWVGDPTRNFRMPRVWP